MTDPYEPRNPPPVPGLRPAAPEALPPRPAPPPRPVPEFPPLRLGGGRGGPRSAVRRRWGAAAGLALAAAALAAAAPLAGDRDTASEQSCEVPPPATTGR